MIINCPHCGTRVRIDAAKYAGKKLKMRCNQCSESFQAEVPPLTAAAGINLTPARPQILIAHCDIVLCETVGSILTSHNFPWASCQDGDTALQLMDRQPPQVAIVDVALPGLFAFEVVEKVRKRPGLEKVKIMLLSSVFNKMAYKRRPNTLYGADDYIEKHHIPLDLISKIHKLNETTFPGRSGSPVAKEDASHLESEEAIDEIRERLQRAEESERVLSSSEQVILAKAERLARIIASDISLYDEAKVAAGIRTGTFFELFATEIAEGRQHFLAKVPESLPGRAAIFDHAFNELIERFRREMEK